MDPGYQYEARACNSITNHTKQALLNQALQLFYLIERSHTLLPVFFTGFAVRSVSNVPTPPDTPTQALAVRIVDDIVSLNNFQVFNCAGASTNPSLHKYSLNRPKPCEDSSTRCEVRKPQQPK